MTAPSLRAVLRVSFSNAWLLAIAYFVAGTAAEIGRRQWGWRWAERLTIWLESYPARVVQVSGLVPLLRHRLAEGSLQSVEIRLAYALISVMTIVALACAVGIASWSGYALFSKRPPSSA